MAYAVDDRAVEVPYIHPKPGRDWHTYQQIQVEKLDLQDKEVVVHLQHN